MKKKFLYFAVDLVQAASADGETSLFLLWFNSYSSISDRIHKYTIHV